MPEVPAEDGEGRQEVDTGNSHLLMLMGHGAPREKGIPGVEALQLNPPLPRGLWPAVLTECG